MTARLYVVVDNGEPVYVQDLALAASIGPDGKVRVAVEGPADAIRWNIGAALTCAARSDMEIVDSDEDHGGSWLDADALAAFARNAPAFMSAPRCGGGR